jgi:outer membrane biosynthesis protein TonB
MLRSMACTSPSGTKPWHIEMRGGRREGQPNHRNSTVDTPEDFTDPGAIEQVAYKIMGAESGGDPNAQNPNSSASGLGQFTDDTWYDSLKEQGYNVTREQALKMKSDPELQRDVLLKHTAINAKKLEANGIAVTAGNLYAMHFLGRGGAPKVLKAADNTPMSALMDPAAAKANPAQARMTVGQFKQWAGQTVGGPQTKTGLAMGAIRSLDTVEGRAGAIADYRRRELISGTLVKQAVAMRDESVLDAMPPELMTPDVATAFAVAKQQIVQANRQEQAYQHQQMEQDRQDKLFNDKVGILQGVKDGKMPNPLDYVDNPEAYDFAKGVVDKELSLDPLQSKVAASHFQNDTEAAALTGDFSGIMGDPKYATVAPSANQLIDRIAHDPNMRREDKVALIAASDKMLGAASIIQRPDIASFRTEYVDGYGKLYDQKFLAKLDGKFGKGVVNFEAIGRDAFNRSLNDQIKAYMTDPKTKDMGVPTGQAELAIKNKAMEDARKEVDLRVKTLGMGGTGEGGNTAEAGKTAEPGKPTFEDTGRKDAKGNPIMRIVMPGATPSSVAATLPAEPATATPAKAAEPAKPAEPAKVAAEPAKPATPAKKPEQPHSKTPKPKPVDPNVVQPGEAVPRHEEPAIQIGGPNGLVIDFGTSTDAGRKQKAERSAREAEEAQKKADERAAADESVRKHNAEALAAAEAAAKKREDEADKAQGSFADDFKKFKDRIKIKRKKD